MADKHLIEAKSAKADRKATKLFANSATLLKFGESLFQDEHWKKIGKFLIALKTKVTK